MPERLKLDRLEPKPKEVHILSSWRDPGGLARDPEVQARLKHIRRCIENGTPLPDGYYRKGVDATTDALLQREGIMHLHLGRSTTAELLWLVQYDDRVVWLELSDHAHFGTRPPGALLKNSHDAALQRNEAEASARRTAAQKGQPRVALMPSSRFPRK